MHHRIVELRQYADAQRLVLLDAVGAVPAELHQRRPSDEMWSVAEVLDHLCRVETNIGTLIGRRIARAREAGLGAETDESSVLDCVDRLGLGNRSRRVAAPEVIMPRADARPVEALVALKNSHTALYAAVATGDGLALGEVAIQHPLFGPLNVYEWLVFLAKHEARHAAQIRDIGGLLGG